MSDHEEMVKQTGRRLRAADKARDKARGEHIAAVVAALKDGERPTDVTEWSPFTATYVRNLARDAGVMPADSPGPRYHPDELAWLTTNSPATLGAVADISALDAGLSDEDFVGGVIGYAVRHGKHGRKEGIRAITDRLVRWATRDGQLAWMHKYGETGDLAVDITVILDTYLPNSFPDG